MRHHHYITFYAFLVLVLMFVAWEMYQGFIYIERYWTWVIPTSAVAMVVSGLVFIVGIFVTILRVVHKVGHTFMENPTTKKTVTTRKTALKQLPPMAASQSPWYQGLLNLWKKDEPFDTMRDVK